ncbi:MAG: SRPBCC domain-containing protein [Planctomycetota bacterium]|nr:SRPBCC domain-containing protein [Planctomycetota bacterium]
MPKTVILAASLPAEPERLYEMYLDPHEHAAWTGHPVTIEARVGAPFRAFGGILSGKVLHLEPKRVIVQSWRSGNWAKDDVDATLVLTFVKEPQGARIELHHVNVPDGDFAGVTHGWEKFYWTPWRAYLEKKAKG